MSYTCWDVKGSCWKGIESDMDEAIGRYLDGLTWEQMPETITLVEYVRNEPTEEDVARLADYVANWFVEHLDEDERLGSDPDGGGYMMPTKRHKEAALVFVRAVLDDWVPRYCSPTGRKEVVNVREWVRENDPERLTSSDESRVATWRC